MDRPEDRAIHPIGVVAERAGISPELVRAWERRYGVVDPARDGAGRRVYSDADIRRLRLLARATAAGRSIGQVASLPQGELESLVAEDEAVLREGRVAPIPPGSDALVARIMARAEALDGEGLEAELVRSASTLGVPVFLRSVVTPALHAVGDAWHAGRLSRASEHLATATVRGVISRLTTGLKAPPSAPLLLVATPEGERHELGALLVATAAALQGWRITYLGADLPAEDIVAAAREVGARAVALSAVYAPAPDQLRRALATVRDGLPAGVPLLVGGSATPLAGTPGIVALADLDALSAELRALAEG